MCVTQGGVPATYLAGSEGKREMADDAREVSESDQLFIDSTSSFIHTVRFIRNRTRRVRAVYVVDGKASLKRPSLRIFGRHPSMFFVDTQARAFRFAVDGRRLKSADPWIFYFDVVWQIDDPAGVVSAGLRSVREIEAILRERIWSVVRSALRDLKSLTSELAYKVADNVTRSPQLVEPQTINGYPGIARMNVDIHVNRLAPGEPIGELVGEQYVYVYVQDSNDDRSLPVRASSDLHVRAGRIELNASEWKELESRLGGALVENYAPYGEAIYEAHLREGHRRKLDRYFQRVAGRSRQALQLRAELERLARQTDRELVVSVYTSDADGQALKEAIAEGLQSFDIEILDEDPPEFGSWYQRMRARVRRARANKNVQGLGESTMAAAQYWTGGKISADVTKTRAEAVALILNALDKHDNAFVRIDTVVLAKKGGNIVVESIDESRALDLNREGGMHKEASEIIRLLEQTSGRIVANSAECDVVESEVQIEAIETVGIESEKGGGVENS